MAKSSMKIVLVDPLGDILFSGDSSLIVISDGDNDDGKATTTSGIYPRMKLEVATDEKDASDDPPAKRGTRAA